MARLVIGILGLGNVGSSVVELLTRNRSDVERRLGAALELRKVLVRNLDKPRRVLSGDGLLTANAGDILDDPEIQVIVELLGGFEPARTYITRSLAAGKHVVTANKDVMANAGREVFAAASAGGAEVAFEGSVGGGIPIIKALKESLAANNFTLVAGIVNGTSNYILSQMAGRGLPYEAALGEAQARGFAEADPAADVDGDDAARKLAILASIAFGTRVLPRDIYTEGIRGITQSDLASAHRLGYAIKPLAIGRLTVDELGRETVEARVHPALVPSAHPLAKTEDEFNAIYIRGHAVGDAFFHGRGAGGGPTASAVVGDIISTGRKALGHEQALSCTCFRSLPVRPASKFVMPWFLRLETTPPVDPVALRSRLEAQGITIRNLVVGDGGEGNVILLTGPAREEAIRRALVPSEMEIRSIIRVEEGE